MTINELVLIFAFIVSVSVAIGSGLGSFFAGRKNLTGDALDLYEKQKTITKEQNEKIKTQDKKIETQDEKIKTQDEKIETQDEKIETQARALVLLTKEVEQLRGEKDTLSHKLALADAKIVDLQEANISTNVGLMRMRERFIQVRDLLIETHRVALVLIDQLINEHDISPKEYPPRIEDFINGA